MSYAKFYAKTEAAWRDPTLTPEDVHRIFRMDFINGVLQEKRASESSLKLASKFLIQLIENALWRDV